MGERGAERKIMEFLGDQYFGYRLVNCVCVCVRVSVCVCVCVCAIFLTKCNDCFDGRLIVRMRTCLCVYVCVSVTFMWCVCVLGCTSKF